MVDQLVNAQLNKKSGWRCWLDGRWVHWMYTYRGVEVGREAFGGRENSDEDGPRVVEGETKGIVS